MTGNSKTGAKPPSTGLRDRAETIARICEETAAQADTEGDVQSRDVFALHGSIIRALLASPAPAGAEGWGSVTRVELIDHMLGGHGLVYVKRDEHMAIEPAIQDDGRTLKIFFMDRTANAAASPAPSPATPPAEAREGHWTDRYQGRPEGAYGWLSDEEVANKVRMLGRSDLDHEAVCTMARDRIAQLSREVRDLRAALPAAPEVPFSAAKNCRRKHGCFAPRPCNLVGEGASPASAKTAEDRGVIATVEWLTTLPNPRSRATGYDAGQRGWKLHIVAAAPGETFTAVGRRRALCGLTPRHGWGLDMFIEDKCKRCSALAAKGAQR